ncbi:MAG TPA: tetratricopeptide repeat protein [Blastocatellia bacterium]|nr:tetratricopeptide repeat protein [Blastocatellia bacterium]
MVVQVNKRYVLGEFELEPDKRLLTRTGEPIHLSNRPFQVLLYLIENRDRVVSRHELLDNFWDGKDVYYVTLSKCIGAIRKALDDRSDSPRFIETRWAEGYRYIGPIEEHGAAGQPSIVEIDRTREVRIIIEEEATGAAATSEMPALLADPARTIRGGRIGRAVTLAAGLVVALMAAGAAVWYWGRPTPQTQLSPLRSLAVLPLRNLSSDPANEYLSDGLTEHLINKLSRIEGLKVISRGSAFMFKDQKIDPREAGKKLGVAAVLEGSVLNNGERVRVNIRIVSADDGQVLWASDTYDRAPGDIFAIQDEIARNTTAALQIELSREGEQRLVKHETSNVEAYHAYLKGEYFWGKRTPHGIRKAIESFEQAVKLDPRYAAAYAGLASSYGMGIWYVPFEPKEALARAKEAALKAIEIDETYAGAYVVMAMVYHYEWNWAEEEKALARFFELDPRSTDYGYAYHLLSLDRPDDAIAWIERAREHDPLSVLIAANVGEVLWCARRYDEAIAACQKALELDPNYAMAHTHLAQTYVQKGMYAEAIAEFQQSIALSERSPALLARLGHAYAVAGRRDEAAEVLDELLRLSKRSYVPPYCIAQVYAGMDRKDEAFAWLEKAYQERSTYLGNLRAEHTLDPLRSDPRFTDLLRRVGFAR